VRSEGTTAVIAVTDNGVGIGGELLPRVFELFVQSQRSLDRAEGGLGVGLSVVQRLVEMHEGSITASSDGHGHGSTFEIRLPLISPESEATSQRENPLRSPKRVLVVDDNVDAAFSVSEVLRLDGHVVEYVHSARAALQSAHAFAPDVILLDIGLPETNGYEVAKRIRASGNLARLIALTGYGQPEDVKRAESAGFTGHLVKPVDLAALERAIAGSDGAE
jgi:CheY-like chemotaxis protein